MCIGTGVLTSRGYLQRRAVAHYAQRTATPSALSLWAQVRYASLSFPNAPPPASAQWDRRLAGALVDAQRAVAAGADAQAPAVISTALGLALSVGAGEARVLDALAQVTVAGGHLADCRTALADLADVAADPAADEELRELVVVIALDCPIVQQRDNALARSVLNAGPDLFGPYSATAADARDAIVAHLDCVAGAQASCPLPAPVRLRDVWDTQAAQAHVLTPVWLEPPAEPEHAPGCRH